MTTPLTAGQVTVQLEGGTAADAQAVLDALELAFPTHTGRGHSHVANVWEDPPTEPASHPPERWSQTFRSGIGWTWEHPVSLAGGITAKVTGPRAAVDEMIRILDTLFHAVEEDRDEHGPGAAVRLRLGPVG
jgi:hypothetical protein